VHRQVKPQRQRVGKGAHALRLGAIAAAQGQGQSDDDSLGVVVPRQEGYLIHCCGPLPPIQAAQGQGEAGVRVRDRHADAPLANVEAE
jgi:hypothetical protein